MASMRLLRDLLLLQTKRRWFSVSRQCNILAIFLNTNLFSNPLKLINSMHLYAYAE